MMVRTLKSWTLIAVLELLLVLVGCRSWAENYVIGHLVPDTDSIVSTLAAAELFGLSPARTGEINSETQYILKTWNFSPPVYKDDFSGHRVMLVDFNQASLAPPGLNAEQILRIVDHHATSEDTFRPATPIYIDIRPWGSTATVLWDLFRRENKEIPRNLAGLMLGAVISDTLHFRSITTTPYDREAGIDLAKKAGIGDTESYAKEIFEAKSRLEGLSIDEILRSDYKEFTVASRRVGMASVATVYPERRLAQKQDFLVAMKDLKSGEGLDYLYLNIVDIWNLNSHLLILGADEEGVAREAFARPVEAQVLFIPGKTSRKAEIFPPIQRVIEAQSALPNDASKY